MGKVGKVERRVTTWGEWKPLADGSQRMYRVGYVMLTEYRSETQVVVNFQPYVETRPETPEDRDHIVLGEE